MKILVINGSPRKEDSNTLILTQAFLKGLESTREVEVKYYHIYQNKIKECHGCFNCWIKSPGTCVNCDNMPYDDYINAEVIIWSLPLYMFGIPSRAKTFLDRTLPLYDKRLELHKNGGNYHPFRYDFSNKKYLLVSSCGFSSKKNNYEALLKYFELLYGKFTPLLCTQGELFREKALRGKCHDYLKKVTLAGVEYGSCNSVSPLTLKALDKGIIPEKIFVPMANFFLDMKLKKSQMNEKLKTFRN